MARVSVRVIPRSSKNDLFFEGETLKVRLKAAPVGGRANMELVRMLAKELKIPMSAVVIVSGQASKNKLVDIGGITVEELRQKFEKIA